ncbi:MAG TPA: VOC family protein [Actinomycetota bacterium]|nr:VOC family protein [Actinomycetota bacterium]
MDRLDYVIRYVRDLEVAVAFYRDVLGLPFRFVRNGYAEFALSNCKLGLYERAKLPELVGSDVPTQRPSAAGTELLFLVEDVDAEAERIRRAGGAILNGPVDRPWGHRTCHVQDPDGEVVELAQEIPRADR